MKYILKIIGVFTLLFLNTAISEAKIAKIKNLSAKEAAETVLKDKKNIVIDIRTSDEYKTGHIKGAVNIDFYGKDFKEKLNKLDKNKSYIVYCRSGNRSGKAIPIFEELGFKEVYHIVNGIIGLNEINYPMEK